MKKLFISLVVLFAVASYIKADELGSGWKVTVVTGTVQTIFEGHGYVKSIVLSSGTTASSGDYAVAFQTAPSVLNGGGNSLFPPHLFHSSAAITPALIFNTTTTVSGTGASLNNTWRAGGECDNCYIDVGSFTSGLPTAGVPVYGGLHIRKSAEASGGANVATVIWKQ